METIHISNQNKALSPNFNMTEFYTAANPLKEWDCPISLIYAAQTIRDYFGVTIIVSSTYRNPDKYGRGSAHEKGLAIDVFSKEINVIDKYNTEITSYLDGNGSYLIEQLRKCGIDGFGIEGHCIHLDTNGYGYRRQNINVDKFGKYTAFEWRPDKNINRSLKAKWTIK